MRAGLSFLGLKLPIKVYLVAKEFLDFVNLKPNVLSTVLGE